MAVSVGIAVYSSGAQMHSERDKLKPQTGKLESSNEVHTFSYYEDAEETVKNAKLVRKCFQRNMIIDSNTYMKQNIVWLVFSINKESLQGNLKR